MFVALSSLLFCNSVKAESDIVPLPSELSVAHHESRTAQRTGRAKVAQQWRAIDIRVDLPSEYSVDKKTGEPFSEEELREEVLTTFASANQYFRPLKLVLRVVDIRLYQDTAEDPYFEATSDEDPYELLSVGMNEWGESENPEYDLIVILGRGRFRGNYGLAYRETSCVVQKGSLVFATHGGDSPRHKWGLTQTLAHEIGHYLGMGHDDEAYSEGPSLMWGNYVQYASGFSEFSLEEALWHVGEGMAGGACFESLDSGALTLEDSDGDGAADVEESLSGSDPEDAGSFKVELKSPIYTAWNSFLNTTNIAELVNPGQDEQSAYISLYSQQGELLHEQVVRIAAQSQLDIILNDLPGFVSDSYGLFKIEFSGTLDGRMSYYRLAQDAVRYEIAYSMPFDNPTYGKSAAGFNTNNPSTNTADAANFTANWLSLVNLSSQTKIFGIYSFDQTGDVLAARSVSVPARGRVDIDGGHELAGIGQVGFHEIVPVDADAPYKAFLVRYGVNARTQGYDFAYPIIARAGNGRPVDTFITAEQGVENWLEVTNTLTQKSSVTLVFKNESGEAVSYKQLELRAHEQRHISAVEILLAAGASHGSVSVVPEVTNSTLSQSMFYYRDSSSGSISAMYGVRAKEALGSRFSGSYNLFLGMDNVLRLSNAGSSLVKAAIRVNGPAGSFEKTVVLEANSSSLISLSDSEQFGTLPDSYGFVEVESSLPNAILSDIVRLRQVGTTFDITAPTDMR